jgi:hypothetical protein
MGNPCWGTLKADVSKDTAFDGISRIKAPACITTGGAFFPSGGLSIFRCDKTVLVSFRAIALRTLPTS